MLNEQYHVITDELPRSPDKYIVSIIKNIQLIEKNN